MHRSLLGALIGAGAGYLAAMAIAAVVPFDTGLKVRDLSAGLAITCCTVGVVVGLVVAISGSDRRRVDR
jgi:hypothetical protein